MADSIKLAIHHKRHHPSDSCKSVAERFQVKKTTLYSRITAVSVLLMSTPLKFCQSSRIVFKSSKSFSIQPAAPFSPPPISLSFQKHLQSRNLESIGSAALFNITRTSSICVSLPTRRLQGSQQTPLTLQLADMGTAQSPAIASTPPILSANPSICTKQKR